MKKIVHGFVSAVLICSIVVFPFDMTAQAQKITNDVIEEKQGELDKVREQIQQHEAEIEKLKERNAALENKVEQLQAQADATQAELNRQKAELLVIQQNIKETNAALEEAEKDIVQYEDQVDARIASMYKTGSFSYLELLGDADSLSDFFYKLKVSKQLAEDDRKVLREYCNKRDAIADMRLELLDAEQKQMALVKSIDATLVTLNAQMQECETGIAELMAGLEEHTHFMDELESVQDEIADVINQLVEEERKRQEEEQKRLEEEEKKKQEEENKKQEEELKEDQIYPYGPMVWPVKDYYYISSYYGNRTNPITGAPNTKHWGLDIAGRYENGKWYAIKGQPILAAASGTVLIASYNSLYGNYVLIDHGGGITTLYAHGLNLPIVSAGQKVKAGDIIMYVGMSGPATGYHLHFEVRENGYAVDPLGSNGKYLILP